MKKFLMVFFLAWVFLGLSGPCAADDGPDYRLPSYDGVLNIREDNSASFEEKVTYEFESDYNGVYVTLGEAGKMPSGFAVDSVSNVRVEVKSSLDQDFHELSQEEFRWELETLTKGRRVKVYRKGNDGDRLRVTVYWNLRQILSLYQDIAVLNWQPLTDWEEKIERVQLRVTGISLNGEDQGSVLKAHRGIFQPQADVGTTDGAYVVTATNLPRKGRVELHAYWPITVMAPYLREGVKAGRGLPEFERLEKQIVDEEAQATLWSKELLPLIGGGLLLAAFVSGGLFWKWVRSRDPFPKNARLYEPPQDLPPAVVARSVFDAEVADKLNRDPSYEAILQATLLDLIDRKVLRIEEGERSGDLILRKGEGSQVISDFEETVLEMAFGDQESKHMNELFNQYELAKPATLRKQGLSERQIQERGLYLSRQISKNLRQVDRFVKRFEEEFGLEDSYREMTLREKGRMNLPFVLGGLAGLVLLASPIVYILRYNTTSATSWVYVPLTLIALVGLCFYFDWTASFRKHGVVKEEAFERVHHWMSFKNMLRDVAKLNQEEIGGIVLWNRLLVYATLFGYAQRVSKVMELNGIRMPDSGDSGMNDLSYQFAGFHMGMATSNLSQGISTASQAANFSVSSSSGSGGGGFSGGGGGGGGGAF